MYARAISTIRKVVAEHKYGIFLKRQLGVKGDVSSQYQCGKGYQLFPGDNFVNFILQFGAAEVLSNNGKGTEQLR